MQRSTYKKFSVIIILLFGMSTVSAESTAYKALVSVGSIILMLFYVAIIALIVFVVARITILKNYFERKKLYAQIKKTEVNVDKQYLKKLFTLNSKEVLVGEKVIDLTGKNLKKISSIKNAHMRLAAENNAELYFAIDERTGTAYRCLIFREDKSESFSEISYDELNRCIQMNEEALRKYKVLDVENWREKVV